MRVHLRDTEKQCIIEIYEMALISVKIKIRKTATILGKLSSSFLGAPLGKLHYQHLERAKNDAMKISNGKL